MKKSIFFAALMMSAFVLTGCDQAGTPETDSTKLWPAQKDEASEWGFVNASGEMKIPAKYKEVQTFSCGFARVKNEEGEYIFVDKSNNKYTPKKDEGTAPDSHFYYDVCVVTYDGHDAYIGTDFQLCTKGEFDPLYQMTADGLAAFKYKNENEWGYCDKNGNQKISPRFSGSAGAFMDGIAVVSDVRNGDTWYYTIDKNGKQLCDETKKPLTNLGEQRVAYENDGKLVLCDQALNEIILDGTYYYGNSFGGAYDAIFTDGLLKVHNKNRDKIAYINPKGQEIIPMDYAEGNDFYEGLAWVKTTGNNGKWIVINKKNGEEALQLTTSQFVGYSNLPSYFHNGLTYYNNGNKVFLVDKSGNEKYVWKMANGGGGYQPDPYDPYDPYGEAPAVNPMAGTKYGPLYEYNMKHFPKN